LPPLPVLLMPLEHVLGLLFLLLRLNFRNAPSRKRDERLSIEEATLLPAPLSLYDEPRPLPGLLNRYPREDRLEETEDEHLLRFGFGQPSRHQVEYLLLVQLRHRGRMGRPHLVCRNFERWHAVG